MIWKKEVYKQCYKSCKRCIEKGDEINNNCIECQDDYIFLNESLNETLNNC